MARLPRSSGVIHGMGTAAFAGLAVVVLSACGASPSSHPTSASRASTSTSTTVPCAARPSHGSQGSATITVTPGTCLQGGQTVTITGSGLKPNSPGGIAQCNGADGEPTVAVAGNQVPVGCSNPLAQTVSTSESGSLDATFPIITGIPGPPATGTDTAGRSAMTDAPGYPCPPTAAQSATTTCNIAFGDASGDQVSIPISFAPDVKPTATKPGSTLSPSVPIG
ncbi:MAG TPA: hypothetical protein VLZ77_01835 [Acidimicrobiales bacterium]|nr:hypothetical protein [Acidimicrobiales bacterium]